MKNNKGYTLVELLIVIAIMFILAGLSFYSVGIIRSARRSAAVSTFDSQIGSCFVKTKAVSDITDKSVDPDAGNKVCMLIRKRTNKDGDTNYCIKVGYDNGKDGVKDITKGTPVDNNDDSTWDAVLPIDVDTIKLTTKTGESANDITEQKIFFNKSLGSVEDGYGTYDFYKSNGEAFAEIFLDKSTGKHHIVYGR